MAAADKVVGLVAIKVPIKKGSENLLAEKILRKQTFVVEYSKQEQTRNTRAHTHKCQHTHSLSLSLTHSHTRTHTKIENIIQKMSNVKNEDCF